MSQSCTKEKMAKDAAPHHMLYFTHQYSILIMTSIYPFMLLLQYTCFTRNMTAQKNNRKGRVSFCHLPICDYVTRWWERSRLPSVAMQHQLTMPHLWLCKYTAAAGAVLSGLIHIGMNIQGA